MRQAETRGDWGRGGVREQSAAGAGGGGGGRGGQGRQTWPRGLHLLQHPRG